MWFSSAAEGNTNLATQVRIRFTPGNQRTIGIDIKVRLLHRSCGDPWYREGTGPLVSRSRGDPWYREGTGTPGMEKARGPWYGEGTGLLASTMNGARLRWRDGEHRLTNSEIAEEIAEENAEETAESISGHCLVAISLSVD